MRGRSKFVVMVLSLAVLAGCSDDGGGAATTTVGSTVATGPGPVVLVGAGAAPLRVVRLTPTVGQSFLQTNEVTQHISIDANGQVQSGDQQLTTQSRITVDAVEPGKITLKVVFTKATSTGTGGDAALAQLIGLGWTMIVDERGAILDVKVDAAGISSPETLQIIDSAVTSLQQSNFVFPAEAIGNGASWTQRSHSRLTGGVPMLVDQATTVTAMDADQVAYSVTSTYTRGEGDIPNLPSGSKVTDLVITGTATSTGTLVAGQPQPATSGTSHVEVQITITSAGRTSTTKTVLDQQVKSTIVAA